MTDPIGKRIDALQGRIAGLQSRLETVQAELNNLRLDYVKGEEEPAWQTKVVLAHTETRDDEPALATVLHFLEHLAHPRSTTDPVWCLARIVAICERESGKAADPERVHPGHWGIAWLLVPLSHEPPDWTVVGHRSAAWLRSLTDGGAT